MVLMMMYLNKFANPLGSDDSSMIYKEVPSIFLIVLRNP